MFKARAHTARHLRATLSRVTFGSHSIRCFCDTNKWNSSEHGFDVDLYASSGCPTRDPKNLERDRMELATIISRAMRNRLDHSDTPFQRDRPLTVIDIGCGNGMIATESCEKALKLNPDFPVDQLDLRLYDPFPPSQPSTKQDYAGLLSVPTIVELDALQAMDEHEPGTVDIVFSRYAIHLLSIPELEDRLLPSISNVLSEQGGCMATLVLSPKGTMLWPLSLQQKWQDHLKVFDPPNNSNEWDWNPSDDFRAERMDGVGRVIIPDGLFSHLSLTELDFRIERSKEEWCRFLRQKPNSFMIPLSDEFIEECCDWISNHIVEENIPMNVVTSWYLFHK